MRRVLALVAIATTLSLILGYALGVSAQEYPVRIVVNGKEIPCDPPAFIRSGRTFVPVRFVSEALGANVDWDGLSFAVIVTRPAALLSAPDIAQFERKLAKCLRARDFEGATKLVDETIRSCVKIQDGYEGTVENAVDTLTYLILTREAVLAEAKYSIEGNPRVHQYLYARARIVRESLPQFPSD